MWPLILLIAVSAATYSFEIIFGVAGTILMLPIMSFFFDTKTLVIYSLLPQFCVQIMVTVQCWRLLDLKFLGKILAVAFIGGLFGFYLFETLPLGVFQLILGIAITLSGVYLLIESKNPWKVSEFTAKLLDFLSGTSHVMLGFSGPIMATRLMGTVHNKTEFRSYILAFFLAMNLVRLGGYTLNQSLTPEILKMMLISIPFLIPILLFANRLHYGIKENTFRRVIAIVIFASGLILLLR